MNSSKVVIKKYANRRLYDTSGSRYINLEDIAALVRNGKDLQVVDAKTGQDVTRVTLTQIIVEDAKEQPTGLPLELLRQLIVASDRVGQEFIMWYLKSAFDAYKKVQNTLENRLTEVQSVAMSPLQMMKKFIPGAATEKGSGPGAELLELEELRKRIAEMEARQQKTKAAGRKLRGRKNAAASRHRPGRAKWFRRAAASLTIASWRLTIRNRPNLWRRLPISCS